MLFSQKGINWNDLPVDQKRGSCCIKEKTQFPTIENYSYWTIDRNIQIFKDSGRNYIESLIKEDVYN
jgi:tRNA(His) 5'-end guanylyltransferase